MSFFSFQDIITSVTGIIILVTLLLTLELVTRAAVQGGTHHSAAEVAELDEQVADAERRRQWLRAQVAATASLLADLGAASPTRKGTEAAIGAVPGDLDALRRSNAGLDADNAVMAAAGETARREAADDERAVASLSACAAGLGATAARDRQRASEARRQTEVTRRSELSFFLPGEEGGKSPLVVECGDSGLTVGRPEPDGRLVAGATWRSEDGQDGLLAYARGRDAAAEYFVVIVHPDTVAEGKSVIRSLRNAGFDVGWDALPASRQLFPTHAGGW